MANNGRIRLLRTDSSKLNSVTKLVPGQPLYIDDKNYLTIAGKSEKSINALPINVRTVKGYYSDSNTLTNVFTSMYEFSGDSANRTYIKSPDEFYLKIINDNYLRASSNGQVINNLTYNIDLYKNTNVVGSLRVSDDIKVVDSLDVGTTLIVGGNASINGTLTVGKADALKDTTLNGNLIVSGTVNGLTLADSKVNGVKLETTDGKTVTTSTEFVGALKGKADTAGVADEGRILKTTNNWQIKDTDASTLKIIAANSTTYQFTNSGQLSVPGNLLVSGYVSASSDEKLKKKIKNIDKDAVKSLIEDIKIKAFTYKKSNERTIGLIAQDIESYNIDGAGFVGKSLDGSLCVYETKFIYALWNYCQQLNDRLKKLGG